MSAPQVNVFYVFCALRVFLIPLCFGMESEKRAYDRWTDIEVKALLNKKALHYGISHVSRANTLIAFPHVIGLICIGSHSSQDCGGNKDNNR